MKLAEALILRADLQKRVEQLRERLKQSAQVQEGEKPPEEPGVLLTELTRLLSQLADLITRINQTNIQTSLADGRTLTLALAQRDVIALHQSVLESLAEVASGRNYRYGRSEIRSVVTVDVAALRRQIDDLARQRRELDMTIQASNWATDLIE